MKPIRQPMTPASCVECKLCNINGELRCSDGADRKDQANATRVEASQTQPPDIQSHACLHDTDFTIEGSDLTVSHYDRLDVFTLDDNAGHRITLYRAEILTLQALIAHALAATTPTR